MSSNEVKLVTELVKNLNHLDRFIAKFEKRFKLEKLKNRKKIKFLSEVSNVRYNKLQIRHLLMEKLDEDAEPELDRDT